MTATAGKASSPVVGQLVGFVGTFGLILLVVTVIVLYEAVLVVDDGDPQALYVLGEFRMILEPGLYFVPPFVSETHPVDPASMTVDLGDRRVEVPEEYREAVEAHTDVVPASDTGEPTPSGGTVGGRR